MTDQKSDDLDAPVIIVDQTFGDVQGVSSPTSVDASARGETNTANMTATKV